VTLKFTGAEDASLQTSFVIDDTAVNGSPCAARRVPGPGGPP
jgi:hypothetical protein